MPTYKGRWTAKVEQDFEFDAESEAAAREILDHEMAPWNVTELHDFEVKDFEEVKDDDDEDEAD